MGYIDGLVQDCGNSSATALELPQSWTKPSISYLIKGFIGLFQIQVTEGEVDATEDPIIPEYSPHLLHKYSHVKPVKRIHTDSQIYGAVLEVWKTLSGAHTERHPFVLGGSSQLFPVQIDADDLVEIFGEGDSGLSCRSVKQDELIISLTATSG